MNSPYFKIVLALVISLSFLVPAVIAGEIYTPQRDDPLRKELLNTIRPRVQAELGQRVLFVVDRMNVEGNWAFLIVNPQKPNGQKIDIGRTRYADDADMMDGLTNYALLKRSGGRWHEIAFVVGPTDVAYAPWSDDFGVSRALLGIQALN